jgi:cyclopropane-fatty-acyl-phospholipid synthase
LANRDEKQLSVLRDWIRKAAPQIEANLHVRLWNGELVPLSNNVTSELVLAINAPDAVRRMIFSPKLMTVVELYIEGLIDIIGTTPLDAAKHWDHIRVLEFGRSVSKAQLAKTLWPFVMPIKSGTKQQSDAVGFSGAVKDRLEDGRNDKDLIAHHYDVSNEFYELFLDPEMVYSCGYFETPDTSLADAQKAKLDMICRKLRLQPGDKLLDIGCGWGGLSCHAAANYGVTVYGVTLSEEQFAYATAKVKRLGLEDKVTIALKDYRDIPAEGQFDKVSQVEMFEHVGIDNHDRHFQRIHDLLRPRGIHFHQASTRMATKDIKAFRKPTAYQEFTTRFIFPGGELDYIGLTCTNMERFRLEVHDVEGMREHFALTLQHWVKNLWENREKAKELVGWPRTRLWLFYLSLYSIAFDRSTIGLFQVVASRRRTGPSGIALARAELYRK